MLHSLAIFGLFFPLPSSTFRGSDFSPKQWVSSNAEKEMERIFFFFLIRTKSPRLFPFQIRLNSRFIAFSSYWALVGLLLTGRSLSLWGQQLLHLKSKSFMPLFPISIYSSTLILSAHVIPLCDKQVLKVVFLSPLRCTCILWEWPCFGEQIMRFPRVR